MKYLFLLLLFSLTIVWVTNGSSESLDATKVLKEDVIKILQAKCNRCHQAQNPSKVFTEENMNGYAKNIYRQVFRWKRMPKGDNIRLTEEEKTILNHWINSINKL